MNLLDKFDRVAIVDNLEHACQRFQRLTGLTNYFWMGITELLVWCSAIAIVLFAVKDPKDRGVLILGGIITIIVKTNKLIQKQARERLDAADWQRQGHTNRYKTVHGQMIRLMALGVTAMISVFMWILARNEGSHASTGIAVSLTAFALFFTLQMYLAACDPLPIEPHSTPAHIAVISE